MPLLAGSVLTLAFSQAPGDLFTKAPPVVDEALRARLNKFYEAHRDGKFRAADAYVAEDSKDTFFEADKRRCKTFEIAKITYAEQFTKADVLTLCETSMLMPPQGVIELKLPLASKWKVVDGEWFWYVEPRAGRESPFGQMFPGSGNEGGIPSSLPKGPGVKDLLRMVRVDKNVLKFRGATGGTDELRISSDLEGEAQLAIEAPVAADLNISLDKAGLKAKETATVTVRYTPAAGQPRRVPSTFEFRIRVQPLDRVIPVQVAFN